MISKERKTMRKGFFAVFTIILPCILFAADAKKPDAHVRFAGETIGKVLVGEVIDSESSSFVNKIVEFKPKANATMFGKTPFETSAKYFAGIKNKKVAWLRVVFDQTTDTKALIAALDKHYGKAKSVANEETRVYSKGKAWLVYRAGDLRISDCKNFARVDVDYMLRDLSSGRIGDETSVKNYLSALPEESRGLMEDLFLNILFRKTKPGDPDIYKIPRDPVELLTVWVPKEFELALKGEGVVKIYRERRDANKAKVPLVELPDF